MFNIKTACLSFGMNCETRRPQILNGIRYDPKEIDSCNVYITKYNYDRITNIITIKRKITQHVYIC